MDFGTIIGLLIGIVAMMIPISIGGQARGFLDPVSAILVIGCTVAATLINFPFSQVKQAVKSLREVFTEDESSPEEIGALLVDLCEHARRNGVLSLESELENMPTEVLRNGLQRVIDGAMPDTLRSQLETELELAAEKMERSKAVLDAMAAYAPAFGMIGTIVGLIKMLLTMKDPSLLGASMGLALVTTFYGALLANLVFLPMAGKLRARSDKQMLFGHMAIHGLVAIASGENPSIVADSLRAFLNAAGTTTQTDDLLRNKEAGAV